MPRIKQYSEKVYSAKFKKRIEREFMAFCTTHEITPSQVIQAAVTCFMRNETCIARKKVMEEV